MRQSLQLVSFWGIPIKIHWTFLILVFWFVGWSYFHDFTLEESLWSAVLVAFLFICVILHEYGHALTASYYDIPTRDIFILPIGGLARLEYLPESPMKEMVIAIAGPLVNLGLALILGIILWIYGQPIDLALMQNIDGITSVHGMLIGLLLVNLTLFIFNLIPAFPMDGGRILRASLSVKWGRRKATVIASYIAQVLAMVFFVYGSYNEMMTLSLIGVFIFFTARWERRGMYQDLAEEEE